MKFIEIVNTPRFRLRLILAVFAALVAARLIIHAFGVSLGYLYLILICLGGLWFGYRGGILSATAASAIFLLEISLYRDWPLRDAVAGNSLSRIFFYYLGGLVMAMLADAERRFRSGNLKKFLSAKKKKIFIDEPLSTKDRFLDVTSSNKFRIWFLICGFLVFIGIRLGSHAFGFSLGYLYLTLVCLAGFWFGLPGGLISAAAASAVFFAEITLFPDWPLRDVVVKSMYLRMLFFFAGGIAMSFLSEMDRQLREKLKELARYDELTNCVNFRWIMEILASEINRCRRYHKEMAVIMMDIDHFKDINDKFGHVAGNKVLREFAATVKANVRNVDIVGRYGGEEFLIVLPEANHKQALRVLERVKSKMVEMRLPFNVTEEGLKPVLHFSAGIASFPLNGKGLEEIINVADRALYQAKSGGRNRIIVERRRFIRIKPLSSLNVEFSEPFSDKGLKVVEIVNISESGMLAVLGSQTQCEEIICRLHLPGKDSKTELKCKVVHKERSDKDLYLMGMYFMNADPSLKDALSALAGVK